MADAVNEHSRVSGLFEYSFHGSYTISRWRSTLLEANWSGFSGVWKCILQHASCVNDAPGHKIVIA